MTTLCQRLMLLLTMLLFAGLAHGQSTQGVWSGQLPVMWMLSNAPSALQLAGGGKGTLTVPSIMMGIMGPLPPQIFPLTYTETGNQFTITIPSLGNFEGTLNGQQMILSHQRFGQASTSTLISAICSPYAAFMGDWQLSGNLNGTLSLGAAGMGSMGRAVTYSVNGNTIALNMPSGQWTATLNGSELSGQNLNNSSANFTGTLVSGTGQKACPTTTTVVGTWGATLPSSNIPVVFELAQGGTGTLRSTDQGGLNLPLTYTVDRYSVTITIPVLAYQATFTGLLYQNQMSGTFNQNGQSPSLTLTKQ